MKKLLLIATIILTGTYTSFAQDLKPLLEKTFIMFDTSWSNPDRMTEASNKLVLISKKFDKDWQPAYYAAYSKIQLSYLQKDLATKDAVIDEAEQLLDQAIALKGGADDEMYVLKAMVAQARLSADGQNRWKKYGKIFDDNIEKAKEINKDNPRIYIQKGTSKFYTPKMFGGGAKNAKPYFEKANELFAAQQERDIMTPYWGRGTVIYFMNMINGDKSED